MKFSKRVQMSPEGRGSNLFLKIKDGESVIGVFRGEPLEFYSKWIGGKSQIALPDDPEAKKRYRLNFITKEDGKFVPKIWEFGVFIYNQLADINDEYPLEKTKVKITRHGTGTDTTYMILPLLKEPLPPKILKEIESIHLNILEHKDKPQITKDEPTYEDDAPEIPF